MLWDLPAIDIQRVFLHEDPPLQQGEKSREHRKRSSGMKAQNRAMKRWPAMILVLLTAVMAAGCQLLGSPSGRLLSQEARIPLHEERMDARSWSTRDLAVHYRAELTGSLLDMEGEVIFAPLLRNNYSSLEQFQLGIIFADDGGRILDMHGLMSSIRADFRQPHRFRISLRVPPGAHYYAFRYTGQAVEGGSPDGGGRSMFFYYPVQ